MKSNQTLSSYLCIVWKVIFRRKKRLKANFNPTFSCIKTSNASHCIAIQIYVFALRHLYCKFCSGLQYWLLKTSVSHYLNSRAPGSLLLSILNQVSAINISVLSIAVIPIKTKLNLNMIFKVICQFFYLCWFPFSWSLT